MYLYYVFLTDTSHFETTVSQVLNLKYFLLKLDVWAGHEVRGHPNIQFLIKNIKTGVSWFAKSVFIDALDKHKKVYKNQNSFLLMCH